MSDRLWHSLARAKERNIYACTHILYTCVFFIWWMDTYVTEYKMLNGMLIDKDQ